MPGKVLDALTGAAIAVDEFVRTIFPVDEIFEVLTDGFETIIDAVVEFADGFVEAFTDLQDTVVEIFTGLAESITTTIGGILTAVTTWAAGVGACLLYTSPSPRDS